MYYKLVMLFMLLGYTLPMSAQLTWDIRTEPVENPNDIRTYDHFLKGISYSKNQETVWTITPPTPYLDLRFSRLPKETNYNDNNTPVPFLLAKIIETPTFFVLPFKTALWVVDKKTGQLLENIPYQIAPSTLHLPYQKIFWFDDGAYTITCKNKKTEYKEQYEATFSQTEGKYLLHFNGIHLFILDKKRGKLIDKVAIQKKWEEKAKVFASTQWKNLSVYWEGIIYR